MVEFVSVCRISEDYNGRIWLTRIADINDQQLSVPYKSNRSTTYFENRDRLYRNDGPSQVDTIGVWRWTATPILTIRKPTTCNLFLCRIFCRYV